MSQKQNKRSKLSSSQEINNTKTKNKKSVRNSSIYSEFLDKAKEEFIIPKIYKNVDKTNLNEDQLRAFELIENHILKEDEPLRLCILGGAGI